MWALFSRGVTHRSLGRFDNAIAAFTRAVEHGPRAVWPVNSRGVVYRLAGRYDEALADSTRVLEMKPDDATALTNRGATCRYMGCHREAVVDLDRAVDIAPGSAWAHYEKAAALHALRHPDRDRQLERLFALLPTDPAEASSTVADKGKLFLAHCVTPHWDRPSSA